MVIGSEYFRRQAATLLSLAKTTTNPRIAAALVEVGIELALQLAPQDGSPLAPDTEHDMPLAPDFDSRDRLLKAGVDRKIRSEEAASDHAPAWSCSDRARCRSRPNDAIGYVRADTISNS